MALFFMDLDSESASLPNGDPAPIDENSSVIYKVIKNKVMPLNPQIVMKEKRSAERGFLTVKNLGF